MTLVLDDSTGAIARQELEVTGPDLGWLFTLICYGPPSADCWLIFSPAQTGTYRFTLTAIGPFGQTDSVTESFVMRPLDPPPSL